MMSLDELRPSAEEYAAMERAGVADAEQVACGWLRARRQHMQHLRAIHTWPNPFIGGVE